MISVLILTRNEQQDLPGCLASVAWSDDIHVFDSFSTDSTVEIAKAAGARVTQREFDNWAAHQNWALAHLAFKHRWVFYLDADERVSPELASSLQTAAANSGENVAFRVQRRDFLNNTWLRHVQASPFYLRLFQPAHMRYERLVNPISIADGPTASIAGYLDHYPFSKGYTHWLTRHNSYSSFEAQQILDNRHAHADTGGILHHMAASFRAKNFHERRFHQKEVFYRLPGRPFIKFFLLYVLKRGFLDGRAGLTYATLQSIYEYFIVLKTRELERARD
ncbi:glycosyltransferase family 2 protein [Edaphobacter sp.]|uniref:glycosyltransferase family 2 protein n=1 Tax=Edaphobacter sp. TaxID=1934404 RepID=UPI002DBDE9BB|nr:glycosyltransferase family 2 protein [Edaphobacter sp.]HEU5340747.1 glycosyltransferase family 2 protein [Edaphobacter sp.]